MPHVSLLRRGHYLEPDILDADVVLTLGVARCGYDAGSAITKL